MALGMRIEKINKNIALNIEVFYLKLTQHKNVSLTHSISSKHSPSQSCPQKH